MNSEENPYGGLNIVRPRENSIGNSVGHPDIHAISEGLVRAVLEHNEVIAIGLLGLSGLSYLYGENVGNKAIMDLLAAKLASTAGTVFVSGQVYDNFVTHRRRESGQSEVPSSWSGHSIIFDPHRDLFDAISRNQPQRGHVLMHDGSLMENGRLAGSRLNPRRQRHLNSGGDKYLSDTSFLSKAHPESSGGIFVNFWDPQNALYKTTGEKNTHSKLQPERVLNVLLTIAGGWKHKNVGIIAPQGMECNGRLLSDVFNTENFPDFRSLTVFQPEELFEGELARQIFRIQAAEQKQISVSIDTNDGAMKSKFAQGLSARGINIGENGSSDVIIVDGDADDKVIYRCWELGKSRPLIALLERNENVEEAEVVGAYAWCLPDIVARALPYKEMSQRY